MHAVLRIYSGAGAKEFFDQLEEAEILCSIMQAVDGFVSYTLVRTAEGGFSVTVNRTKVGADHSIRLAADWAQQNASNTGLSPVPPKVSEGPVIIYAK